MDEIRLKGDADVVAAWRSGLALARRLGFGPFKQACLSSAVLELCRHVVESGSGSCVLLDESDGRARRARVVVNGTGLDFLDQARRRLNAETAIGPAMAAVKLGEVVETCGLEPRAGGARVELTIHETRTQVPRPVRPLAAAARRW